MTYEYQQLENRLPKGVLDNTTTFHAGIHQPKVYPMHSCSIFSNDSEFITNVRGDSEQCDVYLHTDYILQICSTKLFVKSIRNQEGELYMHYFLISIYFARYFLSFTNFIFSLSSNQSNENLFITWPLH